MRSQRLSPSCSVSSGQLLQDGRARVERPVHAVAEAHDLLAALERVAHVCGRVVGRVDLEQHLHDLLVRAAVERTLERADRGCDGGVHVRHGAAGDAGGERRRVHAVLGVQDERGIDDPLLERRRALRRASCRAGWRRARGRPGRDRLLAVAQPLDGGGERDGLRSQPDRPCGRPPRATCPRRPGRTPRARRRRCAATPSDDRPERRGERRAARRRNRQIRRPAAAQPRIELRAVRQLAVPQQVRHFLERRVRGEVVDVVAAVAEHTLGAVDQADPRLGGDDACQPLARIRHVLRFDPAQ
jgi:hypothetical protein